MDTIISKIFLDGRGYFFSKARTFRLKCLAFVSTKIARGSCKLRGIILGDKCKFYGVPIFVRTPQSEIRIGNGCSFRSDSSSNLIGVNRKCLISTQRVNAKITIGDNAGFSGTVIAAAESIKIGKNTICGANTLITDFDWHVVDPIQRRTQDALAKPIFIDDNVWLGVNTVVLKGVSIGKNSVIGANSVVIKDIPTNVVAAGNPCVVVKKMEQKSS